MGRRRSLEKKGKEPRKKQTEKDPNKPKQEPQTLESKRIFGPDQLVDEETMAQLDATDEFASFFTGDEIPKILITTTRAAQEMTCEFAQELGDLIPASEYRKRPPAATVEQVVKGAIERQYTHLLIVNESRKAPDTLSIVKLPQGPTFVFKLNSIKTSKQIHNHGRSTSHTPELILNNFITKLGHRVGRLFISMFPHIPQFQGRQVVTFHNQRDFIFVRRHRYIFEDGKRVRMQEIGPQFTIKLRGVYKATHHLQQAEQEFQWSSHAVNKRHFEL